MVLPNRIDGDYAAAVQVLAADRDSLSGVGGGGSVGIGIAPVTPIVGTRARNRPKAAEASAGGGRGHGLLVLAGALLVPSGAVNGARSRRPPLRTPHPRPASRLAPNESSAGEGPALDFLTRPGRRLIVQPLLRSSETGPDTETESEGSVMVATRRVAKVAGLLFTLWAGPASAQEPVARPDLRLPLVEIHADCRTEMDERLVFGLCEDGSFDFRAAVSYRDGIPTPESVLGYPTGSWHTTYGRMERYLEVLASAAPDRVRVFDYGTSIERQTMHLVAVSSEANVRRLDQVRDGLARLADPRRTTAAEADAIIADLPIIVWLNAANDGNETAAFEAAIELAYELAAAEDARTQSMRDQAVVLINLAHNPESHERFVAWYNAFVMGDANPLALEHRAPWGMSTNNNHYQIDLNRDGLGLTQTESRAVAYELLRWKPQVFVDLHGQTTQYFFPPPAIPVNPLYPEHMGEWWERFGESNAEAFDRHGWSYYVRDVFDLYYPGYWDTYPSLHGATGMTFETDGGGSKGVRWRRDDGTILTFAAGIAHHFVASLATVETAAQNREARLRDFYRFRVEAMDDARRGDVRGVVILEGRQPDGAARLATTLLRHGLEVGRVDQAGAVTATAYGDDRRGRIDVPAGSYVVDLAQPLATLARTLLVPEIELPEGFARQELEKLARNIRRAPGEREGFAFYDLTAWSLPLAAGVEAYWTGAAPGLRTRPLSLTEAEAKAPGGWRGDGAGTGTGGVDGRARSAYLWAAGSDAAVRLAGRLLAEGYSVAASSEPLMAGTREFARGVYVARVGRSDDTLHRRMAELAQLHGVPVHAAQTAFPIRGYTGTGSNPVRSLALPSVAVLAGEGVSVTSYGALWFTLERRLEQPFTALRAADVGRADLELFDVIVLPDGLGYASEVGEAGADRLRDWVRNGGTLVAYGGASRWVLRSDFGTGHPDQDADEGEDDEEAVEAARAAIEAAVPEVAGLPPAVSPGAEPAAPMEAAGAFLQTRLDTRHWLTLGYERDELPVIARSLPLPLTETGANPVVYAEENLVVSGFEWPHLTARTYAGRAYATVDGVGRGTVVLLAEDPFFRAVFDAPAQLVYNALFFGARRRRGAAR